MRNRMIFNMAKWIIKREKMNYFNCSIVSPNHYLHEVKVELRINNVFLQMSITKSLLSKKAFQSAEHIFTTLSQGIKTL